MKRVKRIAGLILMLSLAVGMSVSAQRPVRGALDTTRLGRRGGVGYGQFRESVQLPDSVWFRRPRHSMGPMGMWPGMRGMWNMPRYGLGRDFGPFRYNRPGRGFNPGWGRYWDRTPAWESRPFPGRSFIDRIPDMTEKQKQQINDLLQKQQEEMKKYREENLRKIDEMRKTHRDNILKLLTPEQKKWYEENIRPLPPAK